MGMGLGHHYLIQVISCFNGTLQECLEYMKNVSLAKYEWIELIPAVNKDKKTGVISCSNDYRVQVVRDGDLIKKLTKE